MCYLIFHETTGNFIRNPPIAYPISITIDNVLSREFSSRCCNVLNSFSSRFKAFFCDLDRFVIPCGGVFLNRNFCRFFITGEQASESY
jgi:hypothetical protein